jgi:hypothetical protein
MYQRQGKNHQTANSRPGDNLLYSFSQQHTCRPALSPRGVVAPYIPQPDILPELKPGRRVGGRNQIKYLFATLMEFIKC